MAPQHGFLFDAPVRFVAGIALVAGGVWASTIGTAPAIVKAKGEHPYENPHGETEEAFVRRLSRQGTSKVQRHITHEGVITDGNGKVIGNDALGTK
uniref:Uncharacterized protein n=1 Tax=Haptolina ericina TaxID=156174 RepID=A0A7S3ETJ7_9EUKA